MRSCRLISCAVVGYDGKKEHRRHYHAGRMEMLFGLVDAGKLTLDEAADFAGFHGQRLRTCCRAGRKPGDCRKGGHE